MGVNNFRAWCTEIAESLFNYERIKDHFYINIFDNKHELVIVDLGACNGLFLEAVLRKHPVAKAVLIEPNPFLAQELISTFADRKNVIIMNAAIGTQTCESVPFYLSNNPESSSLHKAFAETGGLRKDGNQVCIRMVSLKELYSLFALAKIDLLKVDIEGAEWDVLENFSKKDFDTIDQISVEFHDFKDPLLLKRTENCIKKLRTFGYVFVHRGTSWLHGTPYYNCLFFKKRIAICGLIVGLPKGMRRMVSKAKMLCVNKP